MAEDTLVNQEIERGASLVKALDEAAFPVLAALWLFDPELERWRLVLATPEAKALQQAYIKILQIAKNAKIDSPDLARIELVLPTDPTVATLSRAVRTEGISGIRFTGNMVNGIYVDDAYIYRAAA
jgi:hypothetical protein